MTGNASGEDGTNADETNADGTGEKVSGEGGAGENETGGTHDAADDHPDLPFPLRGSTLVTGPAKVGKTRLTARALSAWVADRGPTGVVVLDFAPEVVHEGRLLGGRITRFATVPDEAWHGVLAARAPRAEASKGGAAEDVGGTAGDASEATAGNGEVGTPGNGAADEKAGTVGNEQTAGNEETDARAVELAADNAARAARLLDAAPPDPVAVFVNDATIPFQHESGDPRRLTAYCDRAEAAVVNAFESDELGTDDPVSARERAALAVFAAWADRHVRLDGG